MKRTILIGGTVVALILECLALTAIFDTKDKISAGGDVFHNKVENLPMKIGAETRTLSKGTYVVTGQGPVLLTWYWVYEYGYLTASLPALAALIFLWLSFRSRKQSQAGP